MDVDTEIEQQKATLEGLGWFLRLQQEVLASYSAGETPTYLLVSADIYSAVVDSIKSLSVHEDCLIERDCFYGLDVLVVANREKFIWIV